jgi:hypothetical protein
MIPEVGTYSTGWAAEEVFTEGNEGNKDFVAFVSFC